MLDEEEVTPSDKAFQGCDAWRRIGPESEDKLCVMVAESASAGDHLLSIRVKDSAPDDRYLTFSHAIWF
jgi:hypothetical protein